MCLELHSTGMFCVMVLGHHLNVADLWNWAHTLWQQTSTEKPNQLQQISTNIECKNLFADAAAYLLFLVKD